MVSVLILGILVGVLFCNGVPHFIKGVSGEKHRTPFAKSSPATVNAVWGWLNLVAAVLVWHVAPMAKHPRAAFVAVATGALLTGVFLADRQSRRS